MLRIFKTLGKNIIVYNYKLLVLLLAIILLISAFLCFTVSACLFKPKFSYFLSKQILRLDIQSPCFVELACFS